MWSRLALVLFVALPLQAQQVMNFDKTVTPENPAIVIAPPQGQTWTLLRGSFAISENSIPKVGGVGVTVYEQEGETDGLCTNLLRVLLSDNPWVPIVGGYVSHPVWGQMRGMDAPIVLRYPNRLVIHVNYLTGPLKTYTRFTIQ